MENTNYYSEYKDDIILRDILAIDRTILANERTFLSYVRAFLNFIIGGISLIKLFNSNSIKLLGIISILLSFILLIIGFRRYLNIKKDLKLIKR